MNNAVNKNLHELLISTVQQGNAVWEDVRTRPEIGTHQSSFIKTIKFTINHVYQHTNKVVCKHTVPYHSSSFVSKFFWLKQPLVSAVVDKDQPK